MSLKLTLFSDPACPWAYSATPALTVLRWRYRDGIDWRLVTIGLRDQIPENDTYAPGRQLMMARRFRDRYGMPFTMDLRDRAAPTGPACRAIVATRLQHPGREFSVLRAIAFARFTSALVLDEPDDILAAIAGVEGIDANAIVAAIDSPEVTAAYEADKAETRSAAGGATEFQGKAGISDGLVRFTAPSVVFEAGDRRLEAGGFQPLEVYDAMIANLDTSIERHKPPTEVAELLDFFPEGLCTAEVTALLAGNLVDPDRVAAENALNERAGDGRATREALGSDAIWRSASLASSNGAHGSRVAAAVA